MVQLLEEELPVLRKELATKASKAAAKVRSKKAAERKKRKKA